MPPLPSPPPLSLSLCAAAAAWHMFFWIFSEIAHFSISSFGMRFDFCGHISSSFVKRNQRRVTPETSDWLKKGAEWRGEGRLVGCRGTRGRWHLRFGESGSLWGRKLFNGAYMSNIAWRKSRTERRRREVVAAAVAVAADVDVGSCSCCCWKLREIFYYLI